MRSCRAVNVYVCISVTLCAQHLGAGGGPPGGGRSRAGRDAALHAAVRRRPARGPYATPPHPRLHRDITMATPLHYQRMCVDHKHEPIMDC